MKLCPINREKCMGATCGWNVEVLEMEKQHVCAIAVIAANSAVEDGYYNANLNLQEAGK